MKNKKKIMLSSLIALSSVSGYLVNNSEATELNINYKIVTATSLNVRSQGSVSAPVIGSLMKGSKVEVISQEGSWSKIKYNNGYAYVSSSYLAAAESVSNKNNAIPVANIDVVISQKAIVTASALNVRSSAGLNAQVTGKLYKDNVVEVLSYSGEWAKIKYGNNQAYVSKSYLKDIVTPVKPVENVEMPPVKAPETVVSNKKAIVTASILNIRNDASATAAVVGKLYRTNVVDVISYSGDWAKIKYNGKHAYISKSYLTEDQKTTPTNPVPVVVTPQPNQTSPIESKYTTTALNVREGTSISSKVLSVLSQGMKVDVYSYESGWAKIKYNNGYAYVSKSYLADSSSSNNSPGNKQSNTIVRNPEYNGQVEFLDWWTEAKNIIPSDPYSKNESNILIVEDYATKIKFKVRRTMGANHAELETISPEDTAIMTTIWGKFSWTQRPVLIHLGDRVFAASMSAMPHAGVDEAPFLAIVDSRSEGYGRGENLDAIKGNGMSGHMDLHFFNSTRHKDGLPDLKHQENIKFLMKELGYIK